MIEQRDLDYLRRARGVGNLIPVVGSGFSKAAAGLPSWPELLDRLVDRSGGALTALSRTAIEAAAASGELLEAFGLLQAALGPKDGRHYESIAYQSAMNDVFHSPAVKDARVPLALARLAPRVCVTTNYDLLLEDYEVVGSRESATWLQAARMREILRLDTGVIHLHGRYDRPESIILSRRDYDRIVGDAASAELAQGLFHGGVLLFVGMSIDGVGDPHLTTLLEAFKGMTDPHQGERFPHVALVRGKPSGETLAQYRSYGIEPVSFGTDFADLSTAIETIGDVDRIVIDVRRTIDLSRSSSRVRTRDEHLRNIEHFIRSEIFPGRDVRVSYAELEAGGLFGQHLQGRYVQPANATHTTFNFPVSVAAWALIEGRIIAWPDERGVACDFGRLRALGRLEAVGELLDVALVQEASSLGRYLDLDLVREKFDARTLGLSDFYQDWGATDPKPRYQQFLSVPVPILDSLGRNPGTEEQKGVFNIDSTEEAPLLTPRSEGLLKLASSAAEAAYLKA